MNSLFLTVPIALPILGGFWILLHKFHDKNQMIFTETIAILTSLCVFFAIFTVGTDPVTVYSFTNNFSITFKLDGLGRLFAGMVAVM